MSNAYRSVLESGGVTPTGDAVAADVLAGKTFSNANAVGVTGTMVNRGAVSGQATPSQPYTIPEGYHNGSGTVTGIAGTPSLKYVHSIPANAGAKTISCDIGDYIAISMPAYGSATALPVTGADQVDFWFLENTSGICATTLVRATATSITFNYSNPNLGTATVFEIA